MTLLFAGLTVAGLGAAAALAVASFLNVVIHRVPAGLSVLSPASSCPGCGHVIRHRDNVPIVSWLLLRGRCRDCREPISARYPIVELVASALLVAVAVVLWPFREGLTTTEAVSRTLVLAAFLYLMAVSVALALIDIETHRLPNAIVLTSYPVVGLLLAAAAIVGRDPGALVRGLAGGVALVAFYLALAIVSRGGMGLGDVKLAGVLGIALGYLGWGPLAVGSFAAFGLGGTFAVILLVSGRIRRKGGIPFGPWMLAGAWIGVVAGGPLSVLYLSLIGLG